MTKEKALNSLDASCEWIMRELKKTLAVSKAIKEDDLFNMFEVKDLVSNIRCAMQVSLERIEGLEADLNGKLYN
jgi:hypothetical protein